MDAAIDLQNVEWRNRKGRRVNLSFEGGAVVETPWLPSLRPSVLITRGFRRALRDLVVWASGKSNYYITKVLNQFWNATAFSFPATLFAALWTATIDKTSTGATAGEAAYTGYARVSITANTTNFPLSAAGSNVQNATAITFPAASTGPTTCTFFVILDSTTIGAGNILYWGSITSTVIANGDTPQVNVNSLTASEA